MPKVTITKSAPSITVDQIDQFESRNRIKLSVPYKAFLLKTNGGRPTPSGLRIPGWHGVSTGVNGFLGLGEEGDFDLEKSLHNSEGYIPKGFLPIAVDAGGNMLCLGILGSHAGIVYFWDHENHSGDELRSLLKVANTVDELLDMFLTDEELDEVLQPRS